MAAIGADMIGQVLSDRYRIAGVIGDGGMGRVFAAEHVTLRRRLAIKVLKPELAQHEANVERFLQEARAASMIAHPNVVDILDFGRIPAGPVFFVMEFLEGEDLSVLLRRLGRVPWPRVQPILLQVVRGLAAAHKCGVVHRDMKPANIFLVQRPDAMDQVKLLDFGIAKVVDRDRPGNLTGEGSVFGTARYMSPEQAAGLPVDGRSDVYAVGILAYEMLSGRVPFDSDNFMRVATQHINEPIPPLRQAAPDVDPVVEALVMRALNKRPDGRYPSMAEFEAAILGASFESTVAIPNPLGADGVDRTTIYDTRRASRSNPPPVVDVDATVVRPHTRRHAIVAPRSQGSGGAPVFAPMGDAGRRAQPRPNRAAAVPPPMFDHGGTSREPWDRDDPMEDDFGSRGAPPSTGEFLAPILPTGMAAPSSTPIEQHTLPPVNWQGGNPATLEPSRRHEGAETHEFALNVPRREVSRNRWVITVSIFALLLVWAGGAVWFFVLRDDSDAAPEFHPTVVADEPRPSAVPAAPPKPAAEPTAAPRPTPAPPPVAAVDEPPRDPPPREASPRPTPRPAAPRDTLGDGDIDRGFGKLRGAIVECGRTHGALEGTSFTLTFDVEGGRASHVAIQRPWDVTPLGRCVAAAVQAKGKFATAKSPRTGVVKRIRL
jgi:serine/threonine protein kinase